MKKEKAKKASQKKPSYTLWQNLVYYFRILRQFNSKVIYMVAVGIPFSVLAAFLSMYTPKLILDRLAFSDAFTEAAVVIVGIFAVQLLNDLINNGIDAQKQLYDCDTHSYFSILYEKKRLSMDYAYLEDPNVQIMSSKAGQAVKDNHTLTATLPSTLTGLVVNLLCFLHPLILLLLIAATFINYLPQKHLRNYAHQTKDKREAEARRLMYNARLSTNFGIAKDVRLFSMDKWLTDASKSTSRKYKSLLLDLENKGFLVSLVDFAVALLRDGGAYAYLIWRAVEGDISAGDFVLYFSSISGFSAWFSVRLVVHSQHEP